jgi:hypothetical protein
MTRKGMNRNAGFTSVGTGSTLLLGGNMLRWAILIAAPNTNRITLNFQGPAALDQGITLYPGRDPLWLLYDRLGEAIHEDIFAIADTVAQSVGWMEILFG